MFCNLKYRVIQCALKVNSIFYRLDIFWEIPSKILFNNVKKK